MIYGEITIPVSIMENIFIAYDSFSYDKALLVFIAYIAVDALFARYTLDIVKLDEYRAASVGMTTHILLAFGVINYTQNWLYVIPLSIGSWLGTFFIVRKERIHKNRET